ncbi:DUF4296 domain-containing protein [candidate division KSB1 bacterium]|nr:DUF4296 domain-containing protein [candidate division KSB1 bacterium]
MKMRSFYIFIILMITFTNCSDSPEKKETIDRETFIQLYSDVVERYDILAMSKRDAFVDSVFQHYNVSRDAFENTVEKYNKDPERWQKVFDQIIIELENRARALSDTSNQTNKPTQ